MEPGDFADPPPVNAENWSFYRVFRIEMHEIKHLLGHQKFTFKSQKRYLYIHEMWTFMPTSSLFIDLMLRAIYGSIFKYVEIFFRKQLCIRYIQTLFFPKFFFVCLYIILLSNIFFQLAVLHCTPKVWSFST